jgi:hypothetical protein
MDSEAMQKVLEAILSKRDKDGKKYPGTDGDTFRWKRQVEREIGDKKKHGWRLWTRINEDLRLPKEFIIVEEAPSEDKDKEKDKDKDKEKKHVYSIDVDTGATTPKKRIFKNNTAKAAKKLLTKAASMNRRQTFGSEKPSLFDQASTGRIGHRTLGRTAQAHRRGEARPHVGTPSTWTSCGALENP